jgi:hypothetical protein
MFNGRLLVLLGVVALSACERDPEATRALLRAQQQEWARDLGALRQREGELRSRLATLSVARKSAPEIMQAADLRVAPLLNGTRQALTDVEGQARGATGRLEPALRRGGQTALDALDGERTQLGGYLRMMREQLDTADRALGALERG